MRKFFGLFLFVLCSVFVSGSLSANASGTYGCAWSGVSCYSDISGSGSGIPYSCEAGWGHCDADDTGCTPCESITDMATCTRGNPRSCVNQLPSSQGYDCIDTITGCIPCSSSPCEYDKDDFGGSLDAAQTACQQACTGQVPTTFSCVNGDCIEDGNGPYSDRGTCVPNCPSNDGGSGTNPYNYDYSGLRFTNLEAVITPVAKILFYAALVVGVILIIYSGYILMTSEGNPQKVQQGQEQLTAAILGIMFVLLSAAILRVIINSILGA